MNTTDKRFSYIYRQRLTIEELLQLDKEEMLKKLEWQIWAFALKDYWPFDLLLLLKHTWSNDLNRYNLAQVGEKRSWRFNLFMSRMIKLLCEEWNLCEQKQSLGNGSSVELATKMKDYLLFKQRRADAALLAVALLRIGVEKICGC